MTDDPYGGTDPSAEDCIRAGMYWFSRKDLDAARAWWERATQLEPNNPKATECLRLLETFEHKSVDPWKAPDTQTPVPGAWEAAPEHERRKGVVDAWQSTSEHDRRDPVPSLSYPLPATLVTSEEAHSEADGPGEKGVWPPLPEDIESEDVVNITTDPLEFASMANTYEEEPVSDDVDSPWDGPSRTSVVTLDDKPVTEEFDAVAEPTPLPEIDKERFFGRIHDDQALVDYLLATGDLLRHAPPLAASDGIDFDIEEAPEEPELPEEIIFDEPVELTPVSSFETPIQTADMLLAEARDKFALHDFQGVLDSIDKIDAEERTNEATNLLATSRANLLKMYESKIGATDRIPSVQVSDEEVIWLNLNHRAGFILSQIDGNVTYEDLIALSGMDRLDTVRILAELIQQRVIRTG